MSRFLKAISCAVSVSMILATTAVGCGSEIKKTTSQTTTSIQQNATTTSSTKSEAGEIDVNSLKPAELIWYYVGSEADETDPVFEKINEIVNEKIKAQVHFMPLGWGSYETKMKAIIAANEPYDLCFTSNWLNNYFQNVAKGAFAPLDELLPKYAPKLYKQIPSFIWDGAMVNKKLYGVVNYQISARRDGFWLRKDLLEKYKFDTTTVKTYKDLEPFFKQVKANEKGVWPVNIKFDGMWQFVFKGYGYDRLMGSGPAYIKYEDTSLKVLNIYKTQEYKELISDMSDWYKKGYIQSDANINYDPGSEIEAGRFASGNTGTVKPGDEAEFKQAHQIDVINAAICEPVINTEGVISSMTAISSQSKNVERALMLMELINSDKDLYATLCFGEEGPNWKKVESHPNKIEVTPNNEYWSPDWMMGSVFNSYIINIKEDNVLEETKKLNENAKKSVALGFNVDPEPIKSQLAACDSVIKEMTAGLELGVAGSQWETRYNEFIKKLDAAGVNKVIEEIQKQINDWKKNN